MKKIFYLYVIILLFLILFKFKFTYTDILNSINVFRENNYNRVNLIAFKTIKTQINVLNYWSVTNLLANTLPFYILGLLYQVSFKNNLIQKILISFLFILFIEIIQLIFYIGIFDIDDLILNTSFIILGIFSVLIVFKVKP